MQVKSESSVSMAQSVKDSINNQKKIKAILNAYFQNTIEKINAKLQLLNGLQVKYAKHKQFIDSNFNQSFGQFKTFFCYTDKDKESIQNDFDIIEQALVDYKKIACLYQEQLKLINMQANELINVYDWNIKSNALREDNEHLPLNDRVKIRVHNTHLIQNMIEKESDTMRKDLLNKIAEISLYKKNLEHAMSITNIPQLFITDAKEIQNEILKRKNFDFCFAKIMNFIQNTILVKEEERRKTFCVWLNLQNKNELYMKFINVLYENNTTTLNNDNCNINANDNDNDNHTNGINVVNDNKELNTHLNGVISKLDEQLNNLIQVLYQVPISNNNGNSNSNSIQMKEIPDIASNKRERVNENEIGQLTNPDSILHTISSELNKLLKDNFKLTIQEDSNNNSLPTQDKILLMIKSLSERLRSPGIGMNNQLLDISNASLAYSIMIDDKQQYCQSYMNPNYNTVDMEKFVLKHGDKLYFYDVLFDYIEKYALKNRIHLKTELNKDDSQSLGNAIEQIVTERLELKKKYDKCISLLKQLRTK